MRSLWGHCLCSICIVPPLCHIALYCLSAFVSTGFQVYCPKVTFESFVNVKAGYFLLISKSKEQPEIKWLHYRGGRLYLKISFLNCENTKSFRQQQHIMKNGPEYQANWSDDPISRRWSRKKNSVCPNTALTDLEACVLSPRQANLPFLTRWAMIRREVRPSHLTFLCTFASS